MSDDRDFDMEVVEDKVGMQSDNGAVEKEESSSSSRNLDDLPEIERVPDGWELDTIEGVAEDVLGGGTPSKSNEDYWGGEIPWASVKDLDGVAVQDTEDYITEEGAKNSATNLISSGSVVISTRMTVGEAFMNLVDMAINQDLKAIKPDNSRVNTHFLVYALREKDRYLKSLGRGTTVSGITTADLKRTHLARPPLPEQRKIASVLYAVDQAIQKTEEIIEQAKRVKRGLMQDVFRLGIDQSWSIRDHDADSEQWQKTPLGRIPRSWEHVRLGDVVERSGGLIQTGPFGSQLHQEEYVDEGVPVVMPQNIEDGKVDTAEIAQITPTKAEELSRHRLRENDVVLARRGNLERAAVITEKEKGWICGTGCLLIRLPVDEIAGSWFGAVYGYGIVQDQIMAQAVGSTMLNLNQSILENLQLALPPLHEQERITSVLSRADAKIEEEIELKLKLQGLKTGLMQDLLTGEVRTADKAIEVLGEVKAHG
jgi:type I restriction enzyme S subunit